MSRTFTADEIEDADFQAVAVPQQHILLPENCTKGEAIQQLSQGIPSNEYGLPLFFLRSDLLNPAYMVTQDDVDAASELLHYQDGYPTFASGSPFWTQMQHEPHPSYVLFQAFIDLAEEEGIRLIDSLSRRQNIPLETIKNLFQEFYWSSRARAYDLFVVAAEAKKREARTRKAENQHFTMAGTILDKLVQKLNNDPDLIDGMDGKQLIDAMDQMVKLQRLSLGLVGQNASSTSKDLSSPGQTAEVIFRQLTKNVGLDQSTGESLTNRLSMLMSDEGTALQVQELIVKATSAGVNS